MAVEAGVDADQVEGGRVEVPRVFESEPLAHSLVLVVRRVGDRRFSSSSSATEDDTGLLNRHRILEGVADGKGWR